MGAVLYDKMPKYPCVNKSCNNACYKDVNTGHYTLKCFDCQSKEDDQVKNTKIHIQSEKLRRSQSKLYGYLSIR